MCETRTFPDVRPTGGILSSDGVAFEKDGILVSQLDPLDVDRVAGDGDPVPSAAHRAVGASQAPAQTHLLHLDGGRRDRRLLEDRADVLARLDRILQHLVVGLVAALARQIEPLPLAQIEVGFEPLLQHQLARVVSHLLPGDVDLKREEGEGGRRREYGRAAAAAAAAAASEAQKKKREDREEMMIGVRQFVS